MVAGMTRALFPLPVRGGCGCPAPFSGTDAAGAGRSGWAGSGRLHPAVGDTYRPGPAAGVVSPPPGVDAGSVLALLPQGFERKVMT